jgi:hypothetical protein
MNRYAPSKFAAVVSRREPVQFHSPAVANQPEDTRDGMWTCDVTVEFYALSDLQDYEGAIGFGRKTVGFGGLAPTLERAEGDACALWHAVASGFEAAGYKVLKSDSRFDARAFESRRLYEISVKLDEAAALETEVAEKKPKFKVCAPSS